MSDYKHAKPRPGAEALIRAEDWDNSMEWRDAADTAVNPWHAAANPWRRTAPKNTWGLSNSSLIEVRRKPKPPMRVTIDLEAELVDEIARPAPLRLSTELAVYSLVRDAVLENKSTCQA